MSPQKITRWKYGAIVTGIKKRCRKSERHAESELGIAVDGPCEKTAKELAKAWAANNFKQVTKIEAKCIMWTIEGSVMRWEPFTDAHNLRWTVEL